MYRPFVFVAIILFLFFFSIIIFDCHFLTVSWPGCAAAALIRGCAKRNLFDIEYYSVAAAPDGMCSSN